MRLLPVAALAAAVGTMAAPAAAAPSGPGCHAALPVVAHHAGADAVKSGSLPTACATDTGFASSESTIAVTNSGALFYSPAHTENSLARSSDHGAGWQLNYPPKLQYTALWNTVDPFVTVDRRTGRLFWLRATGDLRTFPVATEKPTPYQASTAIAYAHGFQVYSSPDDGHSWTTADYQHENMGDWEKLFVGPPPAGGERPSGYPNVVYVCANAPFEVSGPGRACFKSLDGGATYSLAGYVYPSDSTPDVCPALAANTGVVDSKGVTYQPQACQGGGWLAISRDEGKTYSWLRVKGAPPSSGTGGAFQLAIDDADNLYALWKAGDKLELVISRDHGKSWDGPLAVSAPGVHNVALPALAAGPAGQVGVAYYASRSAVAKALTAYLTQTLDGLGKHPVFFSGALNDPAHPIFQNYDFNATPRADYIGATYDGTGRLWAGAVKQLGAPNSDGQVATTGYVGRLAFPGEAPLGARRGCLARRAPIGPRNIGRVQLGLTRARLARRVPAPVKTARRRWRWCVKRSKSAVSAAFTRKGRVALVVTTAHSHGNRGVRPGARISRLRRGYPRRRGVIRGLFRANPHSPRLIGVRRGRVSYIAIASKALIRKPALLKRYLRVAGVR